MLGSIVRSQLGEQFCVTGSLRFQFGDSFLRKFPPTTIGGEVPVIFATLGQRCAQLLLCLLTPATVGSSSSVPKNGTRCRFVSTTLSGSCGWRRCPRLWRCRGRRWQRTPPSPWTRLRLQSCRRRSRSRAASAVHPKRRRGVQRQRCLPYPAIARLHRRAQP